MILLTGVICCVVKLTMFCVILVNVSLLLNKNGCMPVAIVCMEVFCGRWIWTINTSIYPAIKSVTPVIKTGYVYEHGICRAAVTPRAHCFSMMTNMILLTGVIYCVVKLTMFCVIFVNVSLLLNKNGCMPIAIVCMEVFSGTWTINTWRQYVPHGAKVCAGPRICHPIRIVLCCTCCVIHYRFSMS